MVNLKKLSNDLLNLQPRLSESKNSIKVNFNNIKVAQVEYSEGPVGLTYIHFIKGAKCYMDIRGGWPAYTNALSTNEKQHIDGINISGGSNLGLESATGIMAESLKTNNYNKWIGVNSSVIWSQNLLKNSIYPDKELGRFAFLNMNNILYNGQAGAGRSARYGQGWSYKKLKNGIKILGLVVNNAVGNIYYNNKKIKTSNYFEKFINNIKLGTNTTITVLIINIKLDNDELKQMTHQVNCSIAETIRPFNTFYDGDVFYSCSTEQLERSKSFTNSKLIKLFMICSEVIKEAILNSIK